MQPPVWFAAPYEWIVAPLMPGVLWLALALCLLGIAADLTSASAASRGRLASLCAALLLVVTARGWFGLDSWASSALLLGAFGILIAHTARFGWDAGVVVARAGRSPLWLGLAIISGSFIVKCIALDSWPANLNTYSAMTGEEGLRALQGQWPSPLFAIRAYPLAEGGQSPLHLPILFASMKAFGGTVFAVRFAEIIGSTALLAVLWLWVRTALPGPWAPVALAVFAFSPWHLMQSRFGTFYSLCAALSLGLLWLAERTRADDARGWTTWLAFGVGAGAISWAYAPLQVLYPFFGAVVVAGLLRPRRRLQPLIAVGVFAALVAFQLSQSGSGALMRSEFGQLATDTIIWRKNTADVVMSDPQPLVVVIDNLAHNAQRWFQEAVRDADILIWWAPALGMGFLYALAELWRSKTWMRSAYYLIGMLPPLLIFPLHRRTLIVWPLAYVAGVRLCREVVVAARQCRGQRWMGRVAALTLGVALVFTSLHGLRSYTYGNPAGLVYPYFGPPHRNLMIDEAKRLLPNHHLLFVNPGMIRHAITVGLYEPARATTRPHPYDFVTIDENEDRLDSLLRGGRRNCFIYLNDEQHAWVGEVLRTRLPGGEFVERRGENPNGGVVYSLYFFPAE